VYGGLVRFVVKAGKRDEFLELLRWDARVARDREPGTLRLDVWEVEREPDVVYVTRSTKTLAPSKFTPITSLLRNSVRS
jgi:hypothetical protein